MIKHSLYISLLIFLLCSCGESEPTCVPPEEYKTESADIAYFADNGGATTGKIHLREDGKYVCDYGFMETDYSYGNYEYRIDTVYLFEECDDQDWLCFCYYIDTANGLAIPQCDLTCGNNIHSNWEFEWKVNWFNDTVSFKVSDLDTIKLDSIKDAFQKRLDTGIKMYETAREEYLYLFDLKDDFTSHLLNTCPDPYIDYHHNTGEKWEESVQASMDKEEKYWKEQLEDEEWGRDYDMMIYGAGSRQLYLYITDLIKFYNESCTTE